MSCCTSSSSTTTTSHHCYPGARTRAALFFDFFIQLKIITLRCPARSTRVDNANYFRPSRPSASFPSQTTPLCAFQRGEWKKMHGPGNNSTRTARGGGSGRCAAKSGTTLLLNNISCLSLPSRGNGVAAAKHFPPEEAFNFSKLRRPPVSLPRLPDSPQSPAPDLPLCCARAMFIRTDRAMKNLCFTVQFHSSLTCAPQPLKGFGRWRKYCHAFTSMNLRYVSDRRGCFSVILGG